MKVGSPVKVLPAPGGGHACEPRLAKLGDGRILLAYRAGSARLSSDGRIKLAASRDDGVTWEPLAEPFPGEWRGRRGDQLLAAVAEVGDGCLAAVVGWMDRSDPGRPWRNRDTDGRLPLYMLSSTSDDYGVSWSPVRRVDPAPFDQAVPQAIIRLHSGELLASFETFKHYDEPGPWDYFAGHVCSQDGGRNWGSPKAAAHVDAEGRMWWDPRFAELGDGRIVQYYHGFDYPAGRDLEVFVAWSSDQGASWSKPRPTGLVGQVSWPVPLPGGRLVLFQQRRDLQQMTAVLSLDDGQSYPGASVVVYGHDAESLGAADGSTGAVGYFDDMDGFSFGHPTGVALSSTSVLLAYYAGMRGNTSINVVRLDLSSSP